MLKAAQDLADLAALLGRGAQDRYLAATALMAGQGAALFPSRALRRADLADTNRRAAVAAAVRRGAKEDRRDASSTLAAARRQRGQYALVQRGQPRQGGSAHRFGTSGVQRASCGCFSGRPLASPRGPMTYPFGKPQHLRPIGAQHVGHDRRLWQDAISASASATTRAIDASKSSRFTPPAVRAPSRRAPASRPRPRSDRPRRARRSIACRPRTARARPRPSGAVRHAAAADHHGPQPTRA